VNRRTPEIGIRIALGARAHDVIRTVARESVFTAGVGAALGVLVVATTTTLTKKLFFASGHASALVGTSAADPYVLIPAAATILLVAGVSALAGSRGAAKLDPNVALRAE
jgi:ABC-type antimicrobial peptide transport system permease subunit